MNSIQEHSETLVSKWRTPLVLLVRTSHFCTLLSSKKNDLIGSQVRTSSSMISHPDQEISYKKHSITILNLPLYGTILLWTFLMIDEESIKPLRNRSLQVMDKEMSKLKDKKLQRNLWLPVVSRSHLSFQLLLQETIPSKRRQVQPQKQKSQRLMRRPHKTLDLRLRR